MYINPPDLDLNAKPVFQRRALRAVVYQSDKLLMIASAKYGDYSFPGGGMDSGESDFAALDRELREETGYSLAKMGEQIAVAREFRKSRPHVEAERHTALWSQESRYFLCEIDSRHQLPLVLEDYEAELGMHPVWVDVQSAFDTNARIIKAGILVPPWIYRETDMLAFLSQHVLEVSGKEA